MTDPPVSGAISRQRRRQRAEEDGQVCARREADRAEAATINVELVFVRAEPAHGELRVFYLSWPGIGMREPVVDGGDDEALRGETHAQIEKRVALDVEFGALISHRRATTMDENEARQWRWRADRLAEIECLQRRQSHRRHHREAVYCSVAQTGRWPL